jgi:hypothetical protein
VPAVPLWASVAERVRGQWSIKLQTKLKVCRRVARSNHPPSEAARTGSITLTHKRLFYIGWVHRLRGASNIF